MLEALGITAGILTAVSYVPYIYGIARRRVVPQRSSWLIWAVLAGIAFFAQAAEGATHSLWLSGVDAIGVLIVLGLAIRFGTGGLTNQDGYALLAAGVSLILWVLTQLPILALGFAIIISMLGYGLTITKTYRNAASENTVTWVLTAIAGGFAVLSVGDLGRLELTIYPLYILVMNSVMVATVFLGQDRARRSGESV